ncbi:plasma membrane ATPase 1-like [Dorcoceras hygrometricum]|uniref:Plasma membrane ATPase 1-like n=1 Tax=Dorcoceras hygrometricum TaxID=472368 RepID=A0A2Z7AGT2_9LAMI|nr:plasma membrane ATPase 1-like [Dorcoceras hygrometricum]
MGLPSYTRDVTIRSPRCVHSYRIYNDSRFTSTDYVLTTRNVIETLHDRRLTLTRLPTHLVIRRRDWSTRSVFGKWVYLVTLVMSLFDLQDVCIAIGSITTLDLPMVVDLIGIYGLKGPYCTLTTTNWFLQALSVIPRGSWGDVARRTYHDPMGKSGIITTNPKPKALGRHSPSPPTPPPPLPAVSRRPPLIDRTCSDQFFEENPSALISSGLLVQANEGVSLPVVDLIDESITAYREEPVSLRFWLEPGACRQQEADGCRHALDAQWPAKVAAVLRKCCAVLRRPVAAPSRMEADWMSRFLRTVAQPMSALTSGQAQVVARSMAMPAQPTGHLLAGRRPLDARGCAAHVATCAAQHGRAMHGGGGRRCAAAVRRVSRQCATTDLLLGLSSGLSRAVHEVFGQIFDIGPNLVDFEIFEILGPKYVLGPI